MTKRTEHPTEHDYDREYEKFWRPLVELSSGAMNHEQLRKELYDYSRLIENIMKVYDRLTGGMISKPLTDPDTVIQVAEEHFLKSLDDYEEFTEWKRQRDLQ